MVKWEFELSNEKEVVGAFVRQYNYQEEIDDKKNPQTAKDFTKAQIASYMMQVVAADKAQQVIAVAIEKAQKEAEKITVTS